MAPSGPSDNGQPTERFDKILLHDELKERSDRISYITSRGGTWNEDGHYYSLHENGKELFFDEDGNEM